VVSKVQIPVIGGLRKKISIKAGTTISEFGDGSVTLAQLKSALGITPAAPTTPNTIGSAAPAFLRVIGPGAAGGGIMLGTVNVTLTPPIGALEDSDDQWATVVPGPAGAKGAAGAQGPVLYIEPDMEDPLQIPGVAGAKGATGATGAPGPAIYFEAEQPEDPLQIPGPAGLPGATGAIGPMGLPAFIAEPFELDESMAVADMGAQGVQALPGGGLVAHGPYLALSQVLSYVDSPPFFDPYEYEELPEPALDLNTVHITDVPVVAGSFTGSGSMTWTGVTASTFSYLLLGNMMIVFFSLGGTAGGTASTALQITIPAGKKALRTVVNGCSIENNSVWSQSACQVNAGGTVIQIYTTPAGTGNWTLGTNAADGFIIFPVT
jgi:hypothetical protein